MSVDLCSSNNPNGGGPACDKDRGIPSVLIVGDYEWQPADFATAAAFKARLKTQSLLARGSAGKLIVLPALLNVEKATSEAVTGTLNQGFTEVIRDGIPAWNYGVKIAAKHAGRLRGLNGEQKVMTVDHNLLAWGAATSSGTWKGESTRMHIGYDDFSDGQNSKFVPVSVTYTDVQEFALSAAYLPLDFNVGDYGKLKDVQLTLVSSATNVHNLTGKIATGQIGKLLDVYTDYSTAMANTARWTAKNTATGVAFTITSVAVNAGGYWVVTLDSTMWTALSAGDKVTINWAAPTVLDAAGVTGVEGIEIIVTKP